MYALPSQKPQSREGNRAQRSRSNVTTRHKGPRKPDMAMLHHARARWQTHGTGRYEKQGPHAYLRSQQNAGPQYCSNSVCAVTRMRMSLPSVPLPRKSHCEAYISMPTQSPARLTQESVQRPAVTPAACTCVQPHCLPGPGSGTSRKGQSPQLDVVPKSGPRSGPETGPKDGPQNRSNDSRWTHVEVQNGGRKTVLKNATTDGAERHRRRKPCSAQLRSRSCPDALVSCDHLAL